MDHVARKRWGQHFLSDTRIIERIVAAIAPGSADHVVEIGPGKGALTRPLLERVARLDAIEVDRALAARLREDLPGTALVVHQADALRFDYALLDRPFRAVGNLPYNISTPLLFRLAEFADRIVDCHFMLQKEVVDRMAAPPSGHAYGRLSVMLQYRFRVERLFPVPPGAFRPAPKVESAVVRMRPRLLQELQAKDEELLRRVATAAFSKRRKTLKNALAPLLEAAELAKIGIDPGLRPENLAVGQFVTIANYLHYAAIHKSGPGWQN